MDRDPPAMESAVLPFELRRAKGFRLGRAIPALMGLGMAVMGAAVALGLPVTLSPQTRIFGSTFVVFGLALVVAMQVPRLVLSADRIERISLFGLHRRVTPLSSLRAYRYSAGQGTPSILLLSEDDWVAETIHLSMYESPEMLVGYLSARLRFETIDQQLGRIAAEASAHGERRPDAVLARKLGAWLRNGEASVVVVSVFARPFLEDSSMFRDGVRLVLLVFTGAAAYARTRHRRLSSAPEVTEQLVVAQILPSILLLVLQRGTMPELAGAGWAALLIGAAALPIASWEVAINAQWRRSLRTRLQAYGYAAMLVGPWLLDANVRFATAPPLEFAAIVTELHCNGSRSDFRWRAPALALEDSTNVHQADCLRLKVGDQVPGHRIRGAFGLSVVSVRLR